MSIAHSRFIVGESSFFATQGSEAISRELERLWRRYLGNTFSLIEVGDTQFLLPNSDVLGGGRFHVYVYFSYFPFLFIIFDVNVHLMQMGDFRSTCSSGYHIYALLRY